MTESDSVGVASESDPLLLFRIHVWILFERDPTGWRRSLLRP